MVYKTWERVKRSQVLIYYSTQSATCGDADILALL